jgi:uncharacterized protein (TIGR02145 family)
MQLLNSACFQLYAVTRSNWRRVNDLFPVKKLRRFLWFIVLGLLLLPGSASGQTSYFRTQSGVPYIPVLSAAPTAPPTGAIYMNSVDKTVYWYDGSQWIASCILLAPDGTVVNPIISPSGRTWMDRNLGATRAATGSTDYLAYGSLFQWCRPADGHQLIVWTSSTSGTAVNGTTSTLSTSTSPGHSLFIYSTATPYDWLSTQQTDGSLWWNGTAVGANNPCPTGYHVPTYAEWNTELTYITNATTAYSVLKLIMAGERYYNSGVPVNAGNFGRYWSSTANGTVAWPMGITSSSSGMCSGGYRTFGFHVRCIKNQ